mgnify:CR=1 FL=1
MSRVTQNHSRPVKRMHEVPSLQRLTADAQGSAQIQAAMPAKQAALTLHRKEAAAGFLICQSVWRE